MKRRITPNIFFLPKKSDNTIRIFVVYDILAIEIF